MVHVVRGEGKTTPCLKLVSITLETWNLVRNHRRIWKCKCKFIGHVSGIRIPDGCKLTINKKSNGVTICWCDVIVDFLSLPWCSFGQWSKFHVNIMAGSGSMIIFVYEGLTKNLEIRNNPVWFLPNIWRLERLRDTKCCTNAFL